MTKSRVATTPKIMKVSSEWGLYNKQANCRKAPTFLGAFNKNCLVYVGGNGVMRMGTERNDGRS